MIPLFLDLEFLNQVFGEAAQESALLIKAATEPRAGLMDKTRPELNLDHHEYGRLFINSESDPKSKDTSPGVVSLDRIELESEQDLDPNKYGEQLFPQTVLEIPEDAIPDSDSDDDQNNSEDDWEEDEVSELDMDDWDIGLDEPFDADFKTVPKTQKIEEPELDDDDEQPKPQAGE